MNQVFHFSMTCRKANGHSFTFQFLPHRSMHNHKHVVTIFWEEIVFGINVSAKNFAFSWYKFDQ